MYVYLYMYVYIYTYLYRYTNIHCIYSNKVIPYIPNRMKPVQTDPAAKSGADAARRGLGLLIRLFTDFMCTTIFFFITLKPRVDAKVQEP